MSRIWLSPPELAGDEPQRVLAAMDEGWLAPVGPDLDAFEREVAEECGRAFGVGLASGTAGLHLLLHELGVGAGDEVLVSTFTFAASANPVRYLDAVPVFVDADSDTWQMSPDLLTEALRERSRRGALPKAAIVVDLYGQCADYHRIVPILAEYDIPLLEDAAEALGATCGDRPAGSFGAGAVLSFNGNKIITTTGGGMVVTDDDVLARRCRHLATQAREPAPHYEHIEVGFNYRLSNLLAAFGRSQIADLRRRVARRRAINLRYRDALGDLDGIALMPVAPYGTPNCWLTCITVDPSTGVTPEDLRQHLEAQDVETRPTWKPMHRQPVFADAPAVLDGTSDRLFDTGLCLPSGSGLTDEDQDRVIHLLTERLDR